MTLESHNLKHKLFHSKLLYGVRGGFEDWSYAGSWDPERVIACTPSNGYPVEKTQYNNSTLRVFNMLVESSKKKDPSESTNKLLGNSKQVLETVFDAGYVARNIRLSILAVELVEPYVAIQQVNELSLSDDIIPLEEEHCRHKSTVQVPLDRHDTDIMWHVGGSITIDVTQLWYAKLSDVNASEIPCKNQPSMEWVQSNMKQAIPKSETFGTSRFSTNNGASGSFVSAIDLSGLAKGDELVVMATAMVDQAWGGASSVNEVFPHVPPQSHIVNVRTNPHWYHASADKIVQGRLYWFSMPLYIIVIGSKTMELSSRFPSSSSWYPPKPTLERHISVVEGLILLVLLGVIIIAVIMTGTKWLGSWTHAKKTKHYYTCWNPIRWGRSESNVKNGYEPVPDHGEFEME